MREIEVKILEINSKEIQKTLLDMGAKRVFNGEIKTVFFDFSNSSIVKAKNVLRLRKEDDKAELTYKKVQFTKAAKEAEEDTVEVSSIETMQRILENLGLHVTEEMIKHRISYKIGDVRFDLDRYMGKYNFIPEFMEIESENLELVEKSALQLGFKKEQCLSWSTPELIKHYSNKK